jgi:phosphate transport system substrate-binding protein
MNMKRPANAIVFVPLAVLAACGGGDQANRGGKGANLSGAISADGSSTVFPITEAMAEEFGKEHEGAVRVTVGSSGTGGGFKRFCAGEVDISNASRAIKDTEAEACRQAGIEYVEMPIAFDGLSVVVNPKNSFAQCLTVAELKKVWEPGSKVQRWSQVRVGFPDQPLKLYGPGTNSGTFDYFTEAIAGKAQASRADYTASEDDNVLVQGVAGDENGLGYFGYAYYAENKQRVKLLGVDGGSGCVTPTPETIKNGTYKPLSRPLFIYVSKKALARPEVQAFIRFYNENAALLVPEVGYVPREANEYQENLGKLGAGSTTGQ